MDISNLDCPQFVSFESEAFQRDVLDSSVQSTDSLEDVSKHSNVNEDMVLGKMQSSVAEECKDINYNLQSNMEPSIVEGILQDSCYRHVSTDHSDSVKENFPVLKAKRLPSTIVSFKKATVPKPFQFLTDNRIKSKPNDNLEYKEVNFTSKLRQNAVMQTKKNHITKVQPFHLTEGKKRKHAEKFESLAEQVATFQKKTPERYHRCHKSFQPQEHWEPPPLAAKSPELHTMKRRRVVNALNKEEREEKEVQEMKSYQFHARPVNPKVYNCHSIDKTQGNAAKKIKSFYLKAGRRLTMQQSRKTPEKKYKFKARPVPAKILNGPVGIKAKQVVPPTTAKAPTFEVETRIEKRKILEENKEMKELPQKKAPKPSTSGPPPVVPWVKKPTAVQPFSFDKIDKERFHQKEMKIQEEIENEKKAHVFHAQLMPSPGVSGLPAVERKPPTKPVPFNFMLDTRNPKQFSFTTEESIQFKAQSATVLTKKPFVPEKPPKPEIEIHEFPLHTNKRASEREHLRQEKEAEELEKEKALLLQKAEEERREQMELMKLRREIVHKANPIRQYKPVEIKPSSLPLTQPESPKFETDKRLLPKQ